MSHILLYCRHQRQEPVAEQTACILAEQLDSIGHHVDIAHTLNISRFIVNDYDTVHFIVEKTPLTLNEVLHLGLCKTLQKNMVLSVLNSEQALTNKFGLNVIAPDAFSVSQTNHLKHYRWLTKPKFILPALPKIKNLTKAQSEFKLESFFAPLDRHLDEVFAYNHLNAPVYFDGRTLLQTYSSSQLRKKWNELIAKKKINSHLNLLLSEEKINELIDLGSVAVLLAQKHLRPTEFCRRLEKSLNKNNLVVLNENQSTGFAQHWTSGQNCLVVSGHDWLTQLNHSLENKKFMTSHCKSHVLYDGVTNEISRLYSRLSQQKTSLLTSRSVKL